MRLKVRIVKSVARGHYWGMNPLSAEALGIKCPRRTILVSCSHPDKKALLRHERYEYFLLKKVKAKKKLTRSDYVKVHKQTIKDGFP